jgi:hypothetical protein
MGAMSGTTDSIVLIAQPLAPVLSGPFGNPKSRRDPGLFLGWEAHVTLQPRANASCRLEAHLPEELDPILPFSTGRLLPTSTLRAPLPRESPDAREKSSARVSFILPPSSTTTPASVQQSRRHRLRRPRAALSPPPVAAALLSRYRLQPLHLTLVTSVLICNSTSASATAAASCSHHVSSPPLL